MLFLYYPISCVTCKRFAESKTNTTKRLPAAAYHTYMYTLFINSLWPERKNGSTFTNAPSYIHSIRTVPSEEVGGEEED